MCAVAKITVYAPIELLPIIGVRNVRYIIVKYPRLVWQRNQRQERAGCGIDLTTRDDIVQESCAAETQCVAGSGIVDRSPGNPTEVAGPHGSGGQSCNQCILTVVVGTFVRTKK